MESLSANLAALNNVYGGMLNAMNKNNYQTWQEQKKPQAETYKLDVPGIHHHACT